MTNNDKKMSIGEVSKILAVQTHVIRFWEEKFPQIKPTIGQGGRRYYYNKELLLLTKIKKFLYEDGYTINGLQKLLKKRKEDLNKENDLNVIQPKPAKIQLDLVDFLNKDEEPLIPFSRKKERVAGLVNGIEKNLATFKNLLKTL